MNRFFLLFSPVSLFIMESCQANRSGNVSIPIELTTELRAPSYPPLVTIDPYFNAWSNADNLYDDQVRHWTGKEFPPFAGALR